MRKLHREDGFGFFSDGTLDLKATATFEKRLGKRNVKS
jgi:hypothetical protein